MTDYNIYNMQLKEKAYHIIKIAPIIYIVTFLFYKSHLLCCIISCLAFIYPRFVNKRIINKRKNELNLQFKDMLYSLNSSLSSGKSIELAFMGMPQELKIIYPSTDTFIVMEAIYISRKLDMNLTIEKALNDFAERSGSQDIKNFAEVFRICKRTGADVVESIKRTTSIINDKIEIKQDIDIILASKNLERKVLNIMPLIVLAILSYTAKDYIKPMYEHLAGRIVMTLTAILIVISFFVSKKIMDIEI